MAPPTSTAERFERFQKTITPSAEESATAVNRAHAVARSLHSLFYPWTAYNGDTMQLIGSTGKGTDVRPVRDVDMLFKIPGATWLQYHQHSGNGQSALLQKVRSRLLESYPRSEIRGDGPVVKVLFKSDHHVEVVPGHQGAGGVIFVPQTRNGGSWAHADYAAEAAAVEASNTATSGQTRRLIRMLKAWQLHCNVPIKSLALELRARHFLATWDHRGTSETYDDWMIRDFLSELIGKANATCKIPGTQELCHYGDAWLAKAKTAHRNAVDACGYESKNDNTVACYMWRQIFGDAFGY